MRYTLGLLVLLAWGLWFGGTIAVFVFGLNLFHTFPQSKEIAGQAASAMFVVFGRYELVLAGIALAASALLVVNYPSARTIFLLAILILAGGMAVMFGLGMAPHMEILREQGKAHTEEFIKMHGKSMILMTAQSVMLLATGALLMNALRAKSRVPNLGAT